MTNLRSSVRAATIGLALSGLLALAACGGDDSGSSDTTTATTEAASPTTSADDSTTTVAGDSTDTTSIDTSDIDPISAEDCAELQEDFKSTFGNPDFENISEADAKDAFSRLEDAVPSELKDDVKVLGEAFTQVIGVYEELGDDPTSATDPKALAALEAIGTPEVQAASTRLETYLASCEAPAS